MTTIPKTSKKAAKLIDNAKAIKCYSLSNCFVGQPLTEKPVIWADGEPDNHSPRKLIEVTPAQFLRHELDGWKTKLRENGNGTFTIDVHSNLWYEFESYA